MLLFLLLLPPRAHAESPALTACDKGPTSQLDLNVCASDEYERQDKRLNENYAVAMAHRASDEQAALRKAQRAWILARDAACPPPGPDSGSAGPMDQNLCLAAETRKRADVLAAPVR